MSEPVPSVRGGKPSVGSIAMLVLLALVAYALFFKEPSSGRVKQTSYRDRAPAALHLSDGPAEQTQTPRTGSTVDNPTPQSSQRSTTTPNSTPERPQSPSRPPMSQRVPSHLRPLPPKGVKATSSAIRPKGSRRKSLQWSDHGTSKPIHSSHPNDMMEGGGHGDTPYTRKEPEEKAAPGSPEGYIKDLENHSAFKLSSDDGIPPDTLKLFQDIEVMARFDTRGGASVPDTDADGNPARGDPMQDGWDHHIGPLPGLAMAACEKVAQLITADAVKAVKQLVEYYHKQDKGNGKFWGKFATRAAGKEAMNPARLALGWFADTYRCTDGRMSVPHGRLNRLHRTKGDGPPDYKLYFEAVEESGAGTAMRCLLWLEILAKHFVRQRLLSEQGLYLQGCAARLKVPSIVRSGQDGAHSYEYRLELEVFTANGEDLQVWAKRVAESFGGARGALRQMSYSLAYFESQTLEVLERCQERHVVVRPGWPVASVSPGYVNTRGIETRVQMLKDPAISLITEAEFTGQHEHVAKQLGRLLKAVQPTHGLLLDQRQFHLDTSTVTPENSRLRAIDCFVALSAFGGETDSAQRSIKLLHCGSHLPVVLTDHEGPKLFPLDTLVSLTEVVIPYVSAREMELGGRGYGRLDIGKLLLDEDLGLKDLLASKRVVTEQGVSTKRLKVLIAVTGTAQHAMAVEGIKSALWNAADTAAAGADGRTLREMILGWIEDLKYVYTVDPSVVGGNTKSIYSEVANFETWPESFSEG